jgi:hypothetical protein
MLGEVEGESEVAGWVSGRDKSTRACVVCFLNCGAKLARWGVKVTKGWKFGVLKVSNPRQKR